MMLIKRVIYRLGFRPKLGSIWHSPSYSVVYAFKDAFDEFKFEIK